MSKLELKIAMDSLQVNKPLRLQAKAPLFIPPSVEAKVEKQTQVGNPTLVINPTVVDIETKVLNSTVVQNQTMVHNTTTVENNTMVGNQTKVIAAHISSATEQDSSVQLEARAAEGLEKGYTRVPNKILTQLVSGDFTKNEIKLVLLIARFTISFQRKHAPLSKAVLERQSSLRGPAVLEALSGLVSKGLVEKHQGDQNRPNMLGLILPLDWDGTTKSTTDSRSVLSADVTLVGSQTLVENHTPVSNTTMVSFPSPAMVEKHTLAGVGFPTYFKDKEIYLNKNSLSLLPEKLREYFSELKPAKKRESEWKAFQELKTDYSVENISDCLALVLKRGVAESGSFEKCHSPMAYLAKAMDSILTTIEKENTKKFQDRKRLEVEQEAQKKRQEQEIKDTQDWAVMEHAFRKVFMDEDKQNEAILKYSKSFPFLIPHKGKLARTFAIGAWWDCLSIHEKQQLQNQVIL